MRHSKLGRILVAMRDKEDRVRFSGYNVANFKIFAFCLAAMFAAIGGAMFTLQVGFMSPSFVGIVPSIEMVIYTAVGGRLSIFGAVYGTLLVNFAKTSLSESFPQLWLFGLGALFIAVVLAFPNGLAGIWRDHVQPRIDRLIASRKSKSRQRLDRQLRRRRRAGGVRRYIMLIGHQPKEFPARGRRRSRFRSTASRRSTTCRSMSTKTKSASSSARTAPARPRCST